MYKWLIGIEIFCVAGCFDALRHWWGGRDLASLTSWEPGAIARPLRYGRWRDSSACAKQHLADAAAALDSAWCLRHATRGEEGKAHNTTLTARAACGCAYSPTSSPVRCVLQSRSTRQCSVIRLPYARFTVNRAISLENNSRCMWMRRFALSTKTSKMFTDWPAEQLWLFRLLDLIHEELTTANFLH